MYKSNNSIKVYRELNMGELMDRRRNKGKEEIFKYEEKV
jgi:hypothetical protein